MTEKTGSIAAGRVADGRSGRVEDRPDEVAGDLILRHVARRAGGARPGDVAGSRRSR